MLKTNGIELELAGEDAAAVEADLAGTEEEERAQLLGGANSELKEGFDSR